jgi:hypothetical protein
MGARTSMSRAPAASNSGTSEHDGRQAQIEQQRFDELGLRLVLGVGNLGEVVLGLPWGTGIHLRYARFRAAASRPYRHWCARAAAPLDGHNNRV